MKRILCIILASVMAFITGCNDTPSVEKITTVATAVGKTAGLACELSKTKTEVKEAIATVLNAVQAVVPASGQTFVDAWTPIIEVEVNKLVEAKKIDAASATIVKAALTVACEGIDYVFVKYPKAKDTKELVSAAVTGFINGYKSVVTPTTKSAPGEKIEVDEEAMKYLKDKIAKRTAAKTAAPAPAAKPAAPAPAAK